MSISELRATINGILEEMERNPNAADRDVLQAKLREKVAEVEALGQAMPNRYKTAGEEADGESEDFFDNMPV